jgi:glyoxylase I family protein
MNTEELLREKLHRLEKRLLQPEVRHSAAEVAMLLADDFVEIGGSGRLHDKQSIIEELSTETTPLITISEFRMTILAPDIALVTYHAVFHAHDEVPTKHSLRSSIWKNVGGAWKMIFHQGTPVAMP